MNPALWGRRGGTQANGWQHSVEAAAAAAAAESRQSCLTLCDPIDSAQQAPLTLATAKQKQGNQVQGC